MKTNNIITESSIVREIEEAIQDNHHIFTSMGVVNGLAGVSLFYYYLGDTDLSISFLEKAIEGLNDSYEGPNIVEDIISIGKLLTFYVDNGLLQQEDIEMYFESYDPILEELFVDSLKEDNLSPVTGILKYVNYFVQRTKYGKKDYTLFFSDVVDKIEKLAQTDAETGGIYWISNVDRQGKKLIELGVKHGVMGIVDSLINLHQINFQKERVQKLIEKALLYTTAHQFENKKVIFPFCTDDVSEAKSFSFGLMYGDLGIAYVLHRAADVFGWKEYAALALKTLTRASEIRDDKKEIIKDANLFYGSLGVASFFKLMKEKTQSNFLEEAIQYWYTKTEDYKIQESQWAGFDTTFNKFDVNAQLSFSHGIVGIGTALLHFEKNLDFGFLSFIDYEK
ncbi:hypothetical protein GOQ30_10425 [Flavobacterium sp. TP390]|uniref:Lanthionine synthetase C-like protein n=1 Tax=Flavobacterium profundi TaxID=1774945 RepID=A0A6I4IJ02_9FLAO|nr:lanthionine synthetase LanC family protein [Flavobacterium profundi]MVO09574.1 hypothetical protein [Flavobacterium profundi]